MLQEESICRICLENVHSSLVNPCLCTNGNFHIECFLKWVNISKNTHCEVCLGKYNYIKVEKQLNTKWICIFILITLSIQSMMIYFLYLMTELFNSELYTFMLYLFIIFIYLVVNIMVFSTIRKKHNFILNKIIFKYEKINPLFMEITEGC